MKKIAGLLTVAVIVSYGVNVFADSDAAYSGSVSNEVDITDTNYYSTVLITKESDNADPNDLSAFSSSVVYMDEMDDTFTEALMHFMIKANPSYGKYKVSLGSWSGDTASTYFYIGVDTPSGDTAMTRLGEKQVDNLWRVGYAAVVDPGVYNACQSIKVAFDSNPVANVISTPSTVTFGGYNLEEDDYPQKPVATGEGDIQLAFQINDVPAVYKDSITVFLSASELSEDLLSGQQGGSSE